MDNQQTQNTNSNQYSQATPPPDYSFMNAYDNPVAPPHKSNKAKVLIVVILVLLLIAAGAVALSMSSNNKSQQAVQTTGTPAEDAYVSDRMIAALGKDNASEALNLYLENKIPSTRELFTAYIFQPVSQKVDLTKCSTATSIRIPDPVTQRPIDAHQLQCSGKSPYGPQVLTIGYLLSGEDIEYRSVTVQDAGARQ
jgi:hypothetical protein